MGYVGGTGAETERAPHKKLVGDVPVDGLEVEVRRARVALVVEVAGCAGPKDGKDSPRIPADDREEEPVASSVFRVGPAVPAPRQCPVLNSSLAIQIANRQR